MSCFLLTHGVVCELGHDQVLASMPGLLAGQATVTAVSAVTLYLIPFCKFVPVLGAYRCVSQITDAQSVR